MIANETAIERIIREKEEREQAITDEIMQINEKIRTEKDAVRDLNEFKMSIDSIYQEKFRENSLEQLSLYDQLIKRAQELASAK